jgi:DNA-binding beta-propeller fold protein YncE
MPRRSNWTPRETARVIVLVLAFALVLAGAESSAAATRVAGHAPAARTGFRLARTPASARRNPASARRIRHVGERSVRRMFDSLASSTGGNALGLGDSPGFEPAADARTHTLYVPLDCADPSSNDTCRQTADHVMDVISTAQCNATPASVCRVVARANVGPNGFAVVIDGHTHTLYVAGGIGDSGTVSVLSEATCNAEITSGCAKPLATIKVSGFPSAMALDPATGTVYVTTPGVTTPGGDVFVIDGASCNAETRAGCQKPVKVLGDNRGPDGVDVDVATDTIYVANAGNGDGHTLFVFNGATCNGSTGSGCGQQPHTVTVGSGAFWDVVDQRTDTVYVANFNDGTVSVIDGATCNAHITTGCDQPPATVTTGSDVSYLVVDDSHHTLFANNEGDDTMSAIDTRTCNGTIVSGCAGRPRNEQLTGFNPPAGFNASAFALVPNTGTAYLVNGGGQDYLAAVSVEDCSAIHTSGCRTEEPAVPDSEHVTVLDPGTDTIYGDNNQLAEIDVINGATCHAGNLAGCAPVGEIPAPDTGSSLGAVDDATHTLYVADSTAGTLRVIDTATCNAGDTAGCGNPTPTVTIGTEPFFPVINPATRTIYVPYGNEANRVAVVNGADCNAEITSGCGQTPGVVKVGPSTNGLGVSQATDTIYAPSFDDNSVSLINGATCNGTDQSGCGSVAATAPVGLAPFAAAVNDQTHTVYVANNADGDSPGTVSVINTATCNASVTMGCSGPFATAAVGRSPLLIGINHQTNTVYVSDFSSAGVSALDGSTCNASHTAGCAGATLLPVGSDPFGVTVDPSRNTVYVTDLLGSGVMSVFQGLP